MNKNIKRKIITAAAAALIAFSAVSGAVMPAHAAIGTSVNEEVINQARSVASIIQTRIQLYWSDWVDKQIPYTQDPLANPAPTWATDAEIAGLVGGATPDGMTFTVEGMPVARDGSFYLVATVDSSMGGAAAASYVRNFLPMAVASGNTVTVPVLRPSFALGLSDLADNPNKVNRDGSTDDGLPTFSDNADITFGENGSITFDPATGGDINNVNNLDAKNITVSNTLTAGSGNVTGNMSVGGDLDVSGNITGNLTGNTTGTHTGAVIGNVTGNVTGNLTGDVTGNSSTATRLATARTIALKDGATGTATEFSGAANISIPVTALNADYLNAGTVPVGRLTGNYGINITGKATTAGLADTAKYANGAGLLKDTDGEAAGAFTIKPLSGGYIEFGGASAPTVVKFGATGTVRPTEYQFGLNGNAVLRGIATSATKLAEAKSIALGTAATGTATAFDGTGSITIPVTSLNAGYLNTGTVESARLSGTYAIGISGKAATAGAADTAASAGKLVPTYAAQSSYKDPAVNVNIVGSPNDRDTWIYRDPAGGSSNWGIYHRNIGSTVEGLPADSIGFIGNSVLKAYINLANGSSMFGNTLINTVSGSYNEGIRISKAANNYAVMMLGVPKDSLSGITANAGQWYIASNPNNNLIISDESCNESTGLVIRGDGNLPTWKGTSLASVNSNVASATKLATARTIALGTGATGTATAFNGDSNITIPVSALNADYLNAGTIPTARLSGTYNIGISGKAATAGAADTAKSANTATDVPTIKKTWSPVIHIGTWSRVAYFTHINLYGSVMVTFNHTRGNVVVGNTLLITFGHYTHGNITVLGSHGYTQVQYRLCGEGANNVYLEILDNGYGTTGTAATYRGSIENINCGYELYSSYISGTEGSGVRSQVQTSYKNIIIGDSTVLHSGNYNTYTPTKTGDGASGTWGINVTGSATKLAVARTIALNTAATGTATAFNGTADITIPVTSLNAGYLSAGTIPTARLAGIYGIDISGTARYAKELEGGLSSVPYADTAGSATTLKYWGINSKYNLSAMPWGRVSNYYSTTLWENGPSGMYYGTVYNLGGTTSYNSNSLSLQLAADVNHDSASSTRKLWFRTGNNLGFQNDWKEILHSGNIGSYAAGNVTTPSGTYKHLGAWGVGRTAAGAILVNTAYTADTATYATSAGSAPGGMAPDWGAMYEISIDGTPYSPLSYTFAASSNGYVCATPISYSILRSTGPNTYTYYKVNPTVTINGAKVPSTGQSSSFTGTNSYPDAFGPTVVPVASGQTVVVSWHTTKTTSGGQVYFVPKK